MKHYVKYMKTDAPAWTFKEFTSLGYNPEEYPNYKAKYASFKKMYKELGLKETIATAEEIKSLSREDKNQLLEYIQNDRIKNQLLDNLENMDLDQKDKERLSAKIEKVYTERGEIIRNKKK